MNGWRKPFEFSAGVRSGEAPIDFARLDGCAFFPKCLTQTEPKLSVALDRLVAPLTRGDAGLKIRAELDRGQYPIGIKITDAEWPKVLAQITEQRGYQKTCTCCGKVTHREIPAAIRAQSVGPYLAATLTYFAGSLHASKRATQETCEALWLFANVEGVEPTHHRSGDPAPSLLTA